jgi:hypothetical protein
VFSRLNYKASGHSSALVKVLFNVMFSGFQSDVVAPASLPEKKSTFHGTKAVATLPDSRFRGNDGDW